MNTMDIWDMNIEHWTVPIKILPQKNGTGRQIVHSLRDFVRNKKKCIDDESKRNRKCKMFKNNLKFCHCFCFCSAVHLLLLQMIKTEKPFNVDENTQFTVYFIQLWLCVCGITLWSQYRKSTFSFALCVQMQCMFIIFCCHYLEVM